MGTYEAEDFKFTDSAVRFIEEADAPAIAQLFKQNYGEGYIDTEVYDGTWVKRCVYNDNLIGLVIEEEKKVIATATLALDYGDYNDQIAEMGRFAVSPEHKGRGLGRRLNQALLEVAGDTIDFLFGTARTTHTYIQSLSERCGFSAAGFLPHYYQVQDKRESFIYYAVLLGNGRELRSDKTPQIIPEIAPLVQHVLSEMELPVAVNVVEDCSPYPVEGPFAIQLLDRIGLGKLARIEDGQLNEPLIFGNVSLEQGVLYIRRRDAKYLMATDEDENPMGAIGYQVDGKNQIIRGIELIGQNNQLRGFLCEAFLREAEKLEAKGIEVNLSAYDPRLQQTFYNYGFRPVVYAPAMVFHGNRRLDVIKMLKLNVPYNPGEMELTDSARKTAFIVEEGIKKVVLAGRLLN
jgi:ribosomal protein S18 acetylase RimI-like enzyme